MAEFALFQRIKEELPALRLVRDEPMSRHCSFRIGGPAELFAVAEKEEELAALQGLCREWDVPLLVLGKGTNLLVGDKGIPGLTVTLGEGLSGAEAFGEEIKAGAGISLARLALFAQEHGLTGLEFAHGIPGSLGGAVVMNAGAYGGEMKDAVHSVRCLAPDGSIQCYKGEELDFSYRHSRFSDRPAIVLSASLRLEKGDREEIGEKMRELMAKRSASQPLDMPSAGSTFKRPPNGFAAAMIDGAGLKGYAVGGAAVSEKHAGFVVNTGGATCANVLALVAHIKETVREKYGTELETEIKIVGK